jgi:glycosyltransferase involved in cell wall biosynthesis
MISYPFPPNSSAGAVRSERFARYLPEFGWSCDVVTIKPRKDMVKEYGQLRRVQDSARIYPTRTVDPWVWLKDRQPSNRISRALRSILMKAFSFPDHMLLWVPFAIREGLRLCCREKIKAVYSTSPPHSSHIAGLIIAKLTKKAWIVDFRDPWSFGGEGYGHKQRLLRYIEGALEKIIVRNATLIITNTEESKKKLLEVFPKVSIAKVTCITNGWEKSFKSFERENGYDFQSKEFIITHAGTFYPGFKPYALLYALARWKGGIQPKEIPPLKNCRVILLGSNDSETKRVVSELALNDMVDMLPRTSYEEAKKIMHKSHLLWTSLGVGSDAKMHLPSKVFEYIAAERPIIGFFPEGDAASLIRRSRVGVVFGSIDLNQIISTIYDAMVMRQRGEIPFYKPDNAILDQFTIDRVVNNFAEELDRVTRC